MMNATPHKHGITLAELATYVNVFYGDSCITVNKRFHHFPSQRRLTKAARQAVQKHDRGSQEAQLLVRAEAQIQKEIRSDWYMDSKQRMDDLHKEALSEDRRISWDKSSAVTVDFSVNTSQLQYELKHRAFMDEIGLRWGVRE
jgi:hypothetical protein